MFYDAVLFYTCWYWNSMHWRRGFYKGFFYRFFVYLCYQKSRNFPSFCFTKKNPSSYSIFKKEFQWRIFPGKSNFCHKVNAWFELLSQKTLISSLLKRFNEGLISCENVKIAKMLKWITFLRPFTALLTKATPDVPSIDATRQTKLSIWTTTTMTKKITNSTNIVTRYQWCNKAICTFIELHKKQSQKHAV